MSEHVENELTQTLNKVSREYRIAMSEFNDATKRREQFSLRAERRTDYWLRLGMTGLFIVMILLLISMYILVRHTQSISEQMQLMNQHFSEIHHSTLPSQQSDYVSTLKSIELELKSLNNNMAKVSNELTSIAKKTQNSQQYTHPYYPYR